MLVTGVWPSPTRAWTPRLVSYGLLKWYVGVSALVGCLWAWYRAYTRYTLGVANQRPRSRAQTLPVSSVGLCRRLGRVLWMCSAVMYAVLFARTICGTSVAAAGPRAHSAHDSTCRITHLT